MKHFALKTIISLAMISNIANAAMNTAAKSRVSDLVNKVGTMDLAHVDKISKIILAQANVESQLSSQLNIDSSLALLLKSSLTIDKNGRLDNKSQETIKNLKRALTLKDATVGLEADDAAAMLDLSKVLSNFVIRASRSAPNVARGEPGLNAIDTALMRENINKVSQMADGLGKMEKSEKQKYIQLMSEFNQIVDAGIHPSEAMVQAIIRTKFNNDTSKRADAIELAKKMKECV